MGKKKGNNYKKEFSLEWKNKLFWYLDAKKLKNYESLNGYKIGIMWPEMM